MTSYIHCLEDAVRGIMFQKDTDKPADMISLGERIAHNWISLETRAAKIGYDILAHPGEFRGAVIELIRLLYQIPGADHQADIAQIRVKDADYGGSWIRRGGVGAFFSAVRKVDRVETQLCKFQNLKIALKEDKREEGILDDLGDLRRYMILWEAWWISKEPGGEEMRSRDTSEPGDFG